MPSFNPTPASLALAGGSVTLTPRRVSVTSAVLAFTGGTVQLGPNFSRTLAGDSVRLDRLQRYRPITGSNGSPSVEFQALWQKTVENIEQAFASDQEQIDAILSLIAGLQAAMTIASGAAQSAEAIKKQVALATSRTSPVDGLLSATSDGVVAIAAHSRVYEFADGSSLTVAVNSGSISGLTPGAYVRVYYNDAARTGGAVTYLATTAEIVQSGDVHVVGGVSVPSIGEPPSTGTGSTPPGFVRALDNPEL